MIQNIAYERAEKEQEIARKERRISMARLRASQSREQSMHYTDALGRMCTVHPKNNECFNLLLFFDISHLPSVP